MRCVVLIGFFCAMFCGGSPFAQEIKIPPGLHTNESIRDFFNNRSDVELRAIIGGIGRCQGPLPPPPSINPVPVRDGAVLTAIQRADIRSLCKIAGEFAKGMSVCQLP